MMQVSETEELRRLVAGVLKHRDAARPTPVDGDRGPLETIHEGMTLWFWRRGEGRLELFVLPRVGDNLLQVMVDDETGEILENETRDWIRGGWEAEFLTPHQINDAFITAYRRGFKRWIGGPIADHLADAEVRHASLIRAAQFRDDLDRPRVLAAARWAGEPEGPEARDLIVEELVRVEAEMVSLKEALADRAPVH
jgi:hypothetical protein